MRTNRFSSAWTYIFRNPKKQWQAAFKKGTMKISIICVSTVCGRIEPEGIGSRHDRKWLEQMRQRTGASLLGAATLRNGNPELRCQHGGIPAERIRAVITSSGRVPVRKKIFHNGPSPILFTSASGARAMPRKLGEIARVVIVPEYEKGGLSLRHIARHLEGMGVKHLLIEGGGRLNYSAIQQGVANELLLTIAPRLSGAEGAASLMTGPEALGNPFVDLELAECKKDEVTQELFLRYIIRQRK